MTKKHRPPRSCYIRRAVWGYSPSAAFSRCTLGIRSTCSKCSGCQANVAEQIQEGFQAGLEAGKKDPWFRIDERGNVTLLRELTPEEKKARATCKAIAGRVKAFYGIDNDEEETQKNDQETAQSL